MRLAEFLSREWRSFIADAIRPTAIEPRTAPDPAALIERASEGAAVRQFLESAQVVDFMARSEAQLTTEMLNLPLDNDAGRRDLAVAIQSQRQLMRFLIAKAQDGRMAERELERMSSGKREFF